MRFVLLFALAVGGFAQSFDTYGGWQQSTCAGGNTTHWYTEKVNSRWWFCTPSGNHLFFEGVGGALQTPTNIVAKYGSVGTWASSQTSFIKSLNFNSFGELADANLYASTNSNKVPFFQTILTSNYATVNLNSYASRPTKNFILGLNGYFTAYRGAGCIDAFDSQYATFSNGLWANDTGIAAFAASPYLIGFLADDTDFVCGMGATPDFDTVPTGIHKGHLGFITLLTSPVQVFNFGLTYSSTKVVYSDTKVYTKTAMSSPPATCATATPCSLRDYLQKKYSTIGALNTAWGTGGFYSTFDSAGTVVSSETIGTGNGSTTVFTATLAHTSISPFSVGVFVGGTLQGGDCPWFQSACNIVGTTTTPYVCTAGNCLGSFGGATGTTIATGAQPWAQSSQLTQADCGACGLPQGSYWFRTVWHGPGTCLSTPSREIGATFLTGAPQVTVLAQNNAADIPGCSTGVDIYVSCRVASGAATHGCVSAASAQPAETLQASNVAYPGGSWVEATTGLVSGAALPSAPSQIDYGTAAITITFSTPPAIGAAVTVAYTYGGWMFGTGLMDEDGRNTGWTGTNAICLTNRAGSTTGNTSYACDGVIEAVPNANQTLAADLDAWLSQYAGQYFSVARTAIKTTYPNALYFGADTLGDWGAPPRSQMLQGAAPSLDALFWLWFGNQPNPTTANSMVNYATQYLGDKPMMNFMTLHAQPDSALAGNTSSNCCFGLTTQPLRASQWYTIINNMLHTMSFNSSYQWIGAVWWGLYDYANEGIDWGLKTATDNAYNAHDAVSGSVACAAPLAAYPCGSEPAPGGSAVRPFGDLFGGPTGVTAANALWFASPAAITGSALVNVSTSGAAVR